MTKKERIIRTLNFEKIDRITILGGFLVSAKHYCEINGISRDLFFKDPVRYAISAYQKLGVDGLILLRIPTQRNGIREYRDVTYDGFYSYKQYFNSPEDILAYVETLPSSKEELNRFDANSWKKSLINSLVDMQIRTGEMVWMPTQWDIVHPSFELYNTFGYENYMKFLALYPDAANKLFGSMVEVKRIMSSIIVEVYDKLGVVPLIHIGTDICGKNGPVVSPEFLRKYYFPHVRRSLEPIVEAGFKTVWHADGYITPIIDDLLDCGISGFQGFQWEYGIKLEDLVQKKTINGEKLVIFAGPSVTSTLPFGTKESVKKEVEYIIDTSSNSCALFFLPANDVLPDIPTGNITESYQYAMNYISHTA